ncbi:hypothetical protein SUGI_0622390 [Cryptomeria japonica]|nr:hypothetical protein SUGI_0622390 [Cryptomeria japonica]
MEEMSGDPVCSESEKVFEEQDGLPKFSAERVGEVAENNESDGNETIDARCSIGSELEVKMEQGDTEADVSKEGLVSGIKDDSSVSDGGNVSREGDRFQEQEMAEGLNDVLNLCLNMTVNTQGLELGGNLYVSDTLPQSCYAVNDNNIQDDALIGNASREGYAIPNESVNADAEIQKLVVQEETEIEVTTVQDGHMLVNGSNRKNEEDESEDVPSLEHPENNFLQKSARGSDAPEEITLLQEGVSVTGEVSGLNFFAESVAVGLGERDVHDYSDGQGIEEQARTGVEDMETKSEVRDGDYSRVGLGDGCTINAPKASVEQHCDDVTSAKEHHSVADSLVVAPHIVHSANERAEKSSGDAVFDVNEIPNDISNPLVREDETCKRDDPVVENSSSLEDLPKGHCLDAFRLSEDAKKEEHVKGNLQADHNEEPLVDVFSATSLDATMQLRDKVLTSFADKRTYMEVKIVQDEEDIPLRDLIQTKGRKCERSMPAVGFISETENIEFTNSEASVSRKADMDPNTIEHAKLQKQLTDAAASNHNFKTKAFEATSAGTRKFLELLEEEEKNMQSRLSISPSSQHTRKFRHKRSSAEKSNSDKISLRYCLPEHKFSVGDLVWGKVRSHPWWPGQIFDPSDASESASKLFQRFRKDRLLVAFFGDATFNVCDESQLMPFQSNFSEMAKQTTAKAFQNAVMNALDELARRVELGLTCSCQVEETRHILETKAMDNFGIRQGAVVNDHKDILQAANTFDPLKFLSAIQAFARFPHMERDLEITVACAQASAFLTFKGLVFSGRIKKRKLKDLIAEHEPSKEEAEEDINDCDEKLLDFAGAGSYVKFSKGIRANRQKCQESDPTSTKSGEDAKMTSIMIDKAKLLVSHILNNDSKDLKANKEFNSISPGFGPGVKRTFKSFKSGESIRNVASDVASIPTDSKSSSAANGQKHFEHDSKSPKKANMNISSSWSTQKGTTSTMEESTSTHELLSKLLIVARDPLFWVKKKKMPSGLINSFLQFRNAVFEKSSTNSDVAKASVLNSVNESNEQKPLKSSSKFPGSSCTADSKDVNWTDKKSSLRSTSRVGQAKLNRKADFSIKGSRKRTKRTVRLPSPPWSSKGLKNEPQDKTGDRYGKRYSRRLSVGSLTGCSTGNNSDQKPAALFMRFPKGFALPSEIELKAKFARFGPLEISETKVFRRSGCAQVVYKTSSAAEAAFNFVSENKVFGSGRVSFRLRYFSSGTRADAIEKKDHGEQRSIQQDGAQCPSSKDTLRDADGRQATIPQPSDSLMLSTERLSTCRPNTSGEPQLLLIQQNLEMLTSMLSRTDCTSTSVTATSDNMTPDSKRDIMDEMMSLLQKICYQWRIDRAGRFQTSSMPIAASFIGKHPSG